jgi:hypothetical protein
LLQKSFAFWRKSILFSSAEMLAVLHLFVFLRTNLHAGYLAGVETVRSVTLRVAFTINDHNFGERDGL